MSRKPTFRDLYGLVQILSPGGSLGHVYRAHDISIFIYGCHHRVNFVDVETGRAIINLYFEGDMMNKVRIRKVIDGISDYHHNLIIPMDDCICEHIEDLNEHSQGARGKEIIDVITYALKNIEEF